MSSLLAIQLADKIFMGADTAISISIDGATYRVSDMGKKLYQYENCVIYCSGDMNLSYQIINLFNDLDEKTPESLQEVATRLSSNQDSIEIMMAKVYDEYSCIYQISSYNSFSVVKHVCKGSDMGVWTGGFKTKESYDIALDGLNKGENVLDVYRTVFDSIACEEVGGVLNMYQVTSQQSDLVESYAISEGNLKRLDGQYGLRMINAEIIRGKLGQFAKVQANQVEVIGGGTIVDYADEKKQEAEDYTNTIRDRFDKEVGELDTSIKNTKTYIDGAFKDGIISEAEALSINEHIKTLKKEKTDVNAEYQKLMLNSYLRNTTSLVNAKVNYNGSHSNLITRIQNAIADGKITSIERDLVNSDFVAVENHLATLRSELTLAFNQIQTNYADEKKQEAIDYTNDTRDKISNSLGAMAYEDAVESSKLGSTIITGGYIRSNLIDVDRIQVGSTPIKDYIDNSTPSDVVTLGKNYNSTSITTSKGIVVNDGLSDRLQMGYLGWQDGYGFKAFHEDGSYSIMTNKGFKKKNVYGDSYYLNDVEVQKVETPSLPWSQDKPPLNTVPLPKRMAYKNVEIVLTMDVYYSYTQLQSRGATGDVYMTYNKLELKRIVTNTSSPYMVVESHIHNRPKNPREDPIEYVPLDFIFIAVAS